MRLETRKRLVETARRLFHEQGYTATGIAQILDAAKARSGSLYYFFPTKEDLVLAVLEKYKDLLAPMPLHTGERVRTGQTVGRVGRTGNARTVGCMLHFEVWPSGWLHGSPGDPLPALLRWDRRS